MYHPSRNFRGAVYIYIKFILVKLSAILLLNRLGTRQRDKDEFKVGLHVDVFESTQSKSTVDSPNNGNFGT